MQNDDLKDFFEEDAYKELLNLYEEEETRKTQRKKAEHPPKAPQSKPLASAKEPTNRERSVPARPKAAQPIQPPQPTKPIQHHTPPTAYPFHRQPTPPRQAQPGFKVEIADLDAEFNAPKPERKSLHAAKAAAFARAKEIEAQAKIAQEDDVEIVRCGEDLSKAEKLKYFFFHNIRAFVILGICLVLAICLSTYTISCLNDIFAVRRDSETTIEVNIPPDSTTKDVLKILQKNDLIQHRHFCALVARLDHFRSDNYLSGVYYFTKSMGFERMLLNIKQPAKTGETITLTFPEGYTLDQIVQKLEEKGVCKAVNVYETMKKVDFSSEFSFIKALDNPEDRYHLLEGYMYPDTYDFYVNENPSSIIRKFLNNFQKKWTKEYAAQADKLGMSVDDVITLASIIQKEAYGADQSPVVSSVLHNRLEKSSTYPSLQCDSTTDYINEYIKKNVGSIAQVTAYTEKYSTYKCVGLPVGAICNPGDDAIHAALFPKNTNYYFFAHDVNKKIYVARDDAERRRNNIEIIKVNGEADKKKNG